MKHKIVEARGLLTHYIETDVSSSNPSLIILHGWGSSTASWAKIATILENAGIKVFVPDLPGFGETPEPPTPWGLNEYIEFVRNFKTQLKLEKFILAGHSFGGQICIGYAARHPEDLQKIIVIAAAHIVKRKKIKVAIFLIFSKIGNLIFSMPILCFLKSSVQKISYKLSGEKDYYRASTLMRETMKLTLDEEMRGELRQIKIPTVIIWGEKDKMTPLADAYLLHKEIKNSKLSIFKGGGHSVNLGMPEKLASEIYETITSQ